MLKRSLVVPFGTLDTVKAGDLPEQAVVPLHEKLRPMAEA